MEDKLKLLDDIMEIAIKLDIDIYFHDEEAYDQICVTDSTSRISDAVFKLKQLIRKDMENILINKLELASDLANFKLLDLWSDSIKIYNEDSEGTFTYTDEAQDIFNDYYDEYLTLIESTEVK